MNFLGKIIEHVEVQLNTEVLFIICDYLYQSGYYSYLIKVGLGLGEDAKLGCAKVRVV